MKKTKTHECYSNNRGKHTLNEADYGRITRGRGYKGKVTDQATGKAFHMWGASCGAACWCAIVMLTEGEHKAMLRAEALTGEFEEGVY